MSSARVLLVACCALVAGCATLRPALEAPAGFAAYEGAAAWRAISPEGVVVRVKLVDNSPPQTLEFWTEALRTQLAAAGYAPVAEERIDTRAGPGVILEWAAPVGQEDWIYLTAIALTQGKIAVAEAAGPFEHYRRHRGAILESLRTIDVRSAPR